MLYAFHSTIRVGMIDGYRIEHEVIPEDLARLFAEVGIRDWIIWRSGDRLFHLVDCDDFVASLAKVNVSPVNEKWQRQIGPYVEGFLDRDGHPGFAELERTWALSDQNAAAQK